MRNTASRVVLALATAVLAIGAMPSRAVACSGPPLTFDQVVAGSELIVEGDVEAVLLDGLAYRLAVDEVFKGPSTGATIRIGPDVDPGGRGCEIGLSEGDHVILGLVDVTGALNSLATAVWFIAAEGSLSSPGSLWEVASDAEELRDMLRGAMPDTAQPMPESDRRPLLQLLGVITLAILAFVLRTRRQARG